MNKKVKRTVNINQETSLKFQKKYAIAKAAEVINVFEKLSKKDEKINIKKLRKKVLYNMVDRHRDIESDQEYWSM